MSCEDAAKAVRDQDTFGESVMLQNAGDLTTHNIFAQSSVRDPEADGHDFNCENSRLAILISALVQILVEVAEEVDIRVESDAYPMDKEDGVASSGGVRTVPVCNVLGWRALSCREGNWSEGKECEEAAQRLSVEIVAMTAEADVGEEVDEANALRRRQ